ncbi:hypothetical protein ACIPX0_46185 [Streptomyces sp. NPDC090075]|uniref:hypothetical protein n=1 Tax=Streptomyces sp. NPDC090075 TaxID=3365937 RepID=UPI0037FD5022
MTIRERRGRTLLADHLRWLEWECLTLAAVQLRDLERYRGIVCAEVRLSLGEPWRVGKRPYGHSVPLTAGACPKGFYLRQSSLGINGELGRPRLPSRVDRRRSCLRHVRSSLPTNPPTPKGRAANITGAAAGLHRATGTKPVFSAACDANRRSLRLPGHPVIT